MSSHAADAGPVSKSGELVHLDYELWVEGGAGTELIDTTREEVAQKADMKTPEGRVWGPQPHIVGGDYFPTGIENALVGLKFGADIEKEFAPADAFGERDPKLIELFSMHEVARLPEMRRDDAELELGTVLTIKGRRGRVVSMTAARVRVDFNPAFAGRKVRGRFRIEKAITDPAEKVAGVIELTYGRSREFHVEVHGHTVTVRVPDRTKFDLNWLAAKSRVIEQIRAQVKPQKIELVEEYATPASKEKESEKAKPSESAAAEPEHDHAHPHAHATHAAAKDE
jgi:FKBP-type peptidyl-prolyl cis-trans isomerase 2